MEKVKIGETYTFRDFIPRKYGEIKVIDGKEGTFFEHVYQDFYFIIRDTDDNRALFNRRIESKKWYYVDVSTSFPQSEAGFGLVYQIAFSGECLLDKNKFRKYVGENGLVIANGRNVTYYHDPELWFSPHIYKDFDKLTKNAIRCVKTSKIDYDDVDDACFIADSFMDE